MGIDGGPLSDTEHWPIARIDALSHDGRGVGRVDGKVVFIDDALPGERVRFRPGKQRRSFNVGTAMEILSASSDRVSPKCRYFGVCGGCALQHMDSQVQLLVKQDLLLENLEKIGKSAPEQVLAPIRGPVWGYRRKARLGVRFVPKKGGVLVGFRERRKSYVTPLETCDVLDPRISVMLPRLSNVIAGLSCADRIPQIEVAAGDGAAALVFRHLDPLQGTDLEKLRVFGEELAVQVFLQPNGLDSVTPLYPEQPDLLTYTLPPHDVEIAFSPTDFVQINADVNRSLVDKVLRLLRVSRTDRALDLFCGVGNFSLPLARAAASVVGIEGDPRLLGMAKHNARRNGCGDARFAVADLCAEPLEHALLKTRYDKVVLDPPRTGAIDLIKQMSRLGPERVVYVSCNPATLARDAAVMVHVHGFRLLAAGVVDMFPHTNHVESIAVFTSA